MSPPSQAPSDRNNGTSKPFPLSSSSNGPSAKTTFGFQSTRGRPESSANKARSLPRRPHNLGHDESSDEDEQPPAHEEVSGFDTHTGGAITIDGQAVSDEKKPLVIPVTSQNNWRDRPGVNTKKGKKNLLPREVQAMQEAQKNGQASAGGAVETEGPSMAYGLSFAKESTENENTASTKDTYQPMEDVKPAEESKPLTDDQLALQALIKESTGEVERRSDLVIEASKARDDEEDEESGRYDESSSFKTDVKSRPEPATLDQYNAIPVEEFGAALLRGMGWKDGQTIGRGNYGSSENAKKANEPRAPPRRAGFLGIGAKDSGKGAEVEFGAWGKSAMRKASRKQGEENADGNTEGVYMPVTMRNKNTGEYITEEELATKKKEAKSMPEADEWKERRDRNLDKSGRDKGRDRDYRRRDYDDERSDRKSGSGSSSSRRDRSRSAGRHSSSRRSKYDDDDRRRDDRSSRDSDRDRRRARDDDRDRRDRDYDQDRSRRHRDDGYSSRSSHSRHDRDRDRDRDSHRRRRDD
ncbi:Pre-mRNA-splicing factor spp2 [Penicillium cosmopolitanum]|uniref:Pre-mRNA-splicing factor n=1 Tax=Penicillium cosmopolitanum TaxID=1131564 RepID=A0A9X0BDG5_9EURO|nr:Pre-mRNA-splicing factor spp2 [Penicillium cosmopolitanum]KAJ5408717.1 Pre-mRNA-splicing factor spp2 [Penicillium cosmopolitanum]